MGDATDDAPTHVIDHVYLGSKAHARDREQLQKLQITHILNVTPTKKLDPASGVPNFFEKDKLFEYRRCAVFDNRAEDISGALEGCVAFMERAKFYGRVFVHCSKGVSRSVSMVIAYLIKIHAMSYEDALRFVQAKRRIAQPNPGFEKQLIAYAARMERLRKRKEMDVNSKSSAVEAGPSARPPSQGPSIGPQLPPHLANRHHSDAESGESPDLKEGEVGTVVEDEETTTVVGPALPPHLKRKLEVQEAPDIEEAPTKKRSGREIGPARPPIGPARQ